MNGLMAKNVLAGLPQSIIREMYVYSTDGAGTTADEKQFMHSISRRA